MMSDLVSGKNPGSLTRHVAEFVVNTPYESLSACAIAAGKKSILDGIGLAICGSVAQSGKLLERYFRESGISGTSPVLGTTLKLPPRFAGFVNSVAIHADDFDDTQLAVAPDRVYGLLTHPTAPVLPAALAIAHQQNSSGRDFLLAYQLGVEVECKIAEAIDPRHYQSGFHTTATCGVFAAASAAARLVGLPAPRVAASLSLAASQSAGLRENFGTMTKPFHAGRACESGIFAVELIRMGWTATEIGLEAQRGFFRAAGGGWDDTAIRGKLGHPWTFDDPGISIKPHPSGSLTHPAMTILLELLQTHDLHAKDIARIRVGTNQYMPTTLLHAQPTTELQAKFSMQFCMAILALRRRAGLAEFTDEVVNSEDVRDMIRRVDFHVHPEAEAAGYHKMTSFVEIHTHDGRIYEGHADFGKGAPSNPMSYDDVAAKFMDCCDFAGWPTAAAEEVVRKVQAIEHEAGLSDLLQLISRTA